MTAHFFKLIGAAVACTSLLAACGGGGGGGTPAATTSASASFALGAGYKAYITNGSNKNFNVVVTTLSPATSCNGTATINSSAATLLPPPSTFDGATNVSSSTQDSTLTLTNCSLTSSPTHGTTYYNADALPIALSIVNGEYYSNAGQAAPTAMPSTVMVGNANPNIDTMVIYADNTKAVVNGKRVMGYTIAPDSSTSTAIVNITTTRYDQSTPANLQSTQQSSYRMAADGTLTLLSIDVQFSAFADPKQTHLVYTPTN